MNLDTIRVSILASSLGLLAACGGGGTGTAKVTLQDAPFDAERLDVAISQIAIHYVPSGSSEQANDEEEAVDDPATAGWHTVLSEEQTFEILSLKDNPVEIGDVELEEGKITQIRLYVSDQTASTITIGGTSHDLEVPSGKIKVVGQFDITGGEEETIALDFDADASVTMTGNDRYILRPTVKVVE